MREENRADDLINDLKIRYHKLLQSGKKFFDEFDSDRELTRDAVREILLMYLMELNETQRGAKEYFRDMEDEFITRKLYKLEMESWVKK